MKPLTLCCLFLLLAVLRPGQALPMTDDEEQPEAVEQEQQQPETPSRRHILKISPRVLEPEKELQSGQQSGVFDTMVEELSAAGVVTSGQKPLKTLSYNEILRLMALWHLTQERNYYEAREPRVLIVAADKDNDKIDKQK